MSKDATANTIQRLGSPCPACKKHRLEPGDGHEYALFASEVAVLPSTTLADFFTLFKEHQWTALNRVQRFEGGSNAVEVFALRCTAGLSMLAVRSPAELCDS